MHKTADIVFPKTGIFSAEVILNESSFIESALSDSRQTIMETAV